MSGQIAQKSPWANRIVGHGEEAPEKLISNPANWRQHPHHQAEALEDVLEQVGLVATVMVNKRSGHLVDGHLRVELALRRGEPTIPVTYIDLDEEEERIILACLDPIGAMACADRDKLAELLAGIESQDLAGLLDAVARANRIALDLGGDGLTDQDEVPEPPAVPVSRPGDLWQLEEHRLLCGDSTSQDDVRRLMDGKRAVLMATDPPYLVDYDGGNHPQTWGKDGSAIRAEEKTKHWDAYQDHEHAVGFYSDFLKLALEYALIEAPPIYQWFGMMRIAVVLEAWKVNGLLAHQVIIWHKSRPVLARCDFMWDYEPCLYGWPAGKRPEPELRPPANATAVWDVDQREGVEEDLGSVHPTIKPVELIRRPILWHAKPGEIIYEPFSGSGTAIIAAEMTGRHCYAIELSPAFVDVAITRWQSYSGEQARLEGDGRSFGEIAVERTG
jgi:DNA modification methylase